jgi:Trk-type K+ transport system membrane component
MAQPGVDQDRSQPGDAAAKISGQRARQGQNIKGMIWVLVIGVLLVAAAFGVMLALQSEPAAVVNDSRNEATAATQGLSPGDGQNPQGQETAPSPQ